MKQFAVAALLTMSCLLPAVAAGQQPTETPAQQAYKNRREQLVKELQNAQKAVAEIRGERVQLQTRIENVIAEALRQRAATLMLSNETKALNQLDSVLTLSQDNLLAQRDRFTLIGDAVRRRTGAVLVVLLRADSTQNQLIQSASLSVDNAQTEQRTYSVTANSALSMGAVDQLFRANVLPTSHTVTLSTIVNNQPVTQTMTVSVPTESVTYVQFAVRNGQIIQTTWTSRGTTPF
jgi:hypothetical protein